MSRLDYIRAFDALLAPNGFKRRELTWNRRSGRLVDVVDLQISKPGDATTANVGVADPEVYRRCWGEDLEGFVEEPSCTVRARVGELSSGKDLWWPIEQIEGPTKLTGLVENHGLPFIEGMHSRVAMAKYLTNAGVRKRKYPPPIIYLAILNYDLGDKVAACALLDELSKTSIGAWRTRVNQVLLRLECASVSVLAG